VHTDLDTLVTALYVAIDKTLQADPQLRPWRPKVGSRLSHGPGGAGDRDAVGNCGPGLVGLRAYAGGALIRWPSLLQPGGAGRSVGDRAELLGADRGLVCRWVV
jgi:hypothetical protein